MPKLNGFSGQFALRNVNSIKLFDRVDGTLYAESEFPKTAPVNQTVDNNYATGGVGNSRMAVFKSNKNIEIPIENAFFTIALLSGQAGSYAVEITNVVFDLTYTTTVVDEATISYALATGGDITVEEVTAANNNTPIRRFTQVASGPVADEYSITGTAITFFAGDVPIGSFIRVIQEVTTTNDIDVLDAKADVFSGTYKAVLEVEVVDVITDQLFFGQLTIPRANLDDAVNLAFQNDGEVAVHNASLNGLADVLTKSLWSLRVFTSADL